MPRKTDSNNPADWLFIAESDLDGLRVLARQEVSYSLCRSKLAEVLEKVLKAELIRTGWFLQKTHDLEILLGHLKSRHSDLVPQSAPLCKAFAEAYFSDRYPGFDMEDPDWPDMRAKLEQVASLMATVKSRVGTGT
ncbi:MAG: HEPN domain-containing protein [Verrucomicrobiae bacterium]|nr:HEPN domain-containing protein [Verrucomicrobiae bacterium]